MEKNDLKNEMLMSVKMEAEEIINNENASESLSLGFVQDDQKADDVLYWHRLAENEYAKVEKFRNDEIERITRFAETKIRAIDKRLEFYTSTLEAYFITGNGKTKSLTNGLLGARKQPDRVIIEDEERFIKWWTESPEGANDLVKRTIKPIIKEIKSYIKEIGECPEGVGYKEGTKKFYVKTHE